MNYFCFNIFCEIVPWHYIIFYFKINLVVLQKGGICKKDSKGPRSHETEERGGQASLTRNGVLRGLWDRNMFWEAARWIHLHTPTSCMTCLNTPRAGRYMPWDRPAGNVWELLYLRSSSRTYLRVWLERKKEHERGWLCSRRLQVTELSSWWLCSKWRQSGSHISRSSRLPWPLD